MTCLTILEKILLSTVLYKFNKKSKRQERSILITSKAIYNVNKQDLLATFMSVFSNSFKIRRRIDITKILGISVSEQSSEFVLHIGDEYDYRYASPNRRDRILQVLCSSYYHNAPNKPLTFFFKVLSEKLGTLLQYFYRKISIWSSLPLQRSIEKVVSTECLKIMES